MKVGINMSLIARFDGNMNVIGRLLKEYRMKKDLSYEKLSAKLAISTLFLLSVTILSLVIIISIF